ncbi:uncharacterized protein CG4951 isoform X2 [Episyrphus balteatus]|uniref:uncharacterized protein CG4951 isoform X2 n=1 Tax=Episyrphus balteatus TaxID=286459 RepID=UPI00248612A1|nr:uncharacterized protein CG4951 isoform X2 [Episyrphus balteatus]
METCSHLLEIRKVMDKCLVCDIQVQDITLTLTGLQIQTNKWLHLEDWLEIDSAIEKLLKPFSQSETLDGFDEKDFHLGGAIRIDCKKTKLTKSQKRILGEDKKYLPIALEINVTKINTLELIEQINMFEEKLSRLNNNGLMSPTTEEKKTLIHKESLREYDPTAHIAVTEQNSTISEPYSPKPIAIDSSSPDQIPESPNRVPNYKPARIAHSKPKDKEKDIEVIENNNNEKPSSSSSRRRHSPEEKVKSKSSKESSRSHGTKRTASHSSNKPTRNAELFGSDDSDQETKSPLKSSSSKTHQSSSHSSSNDKDSKRKRIKLKDESSSSKTSLDGWLSKGTIKPGDKPSSEKTNGKSSSSSSSKKSSRHESSSKSHTSKDDQTRSEKQAMEMKKLGELKDALKARRKSPQPEIEILNLTHLSVDQIIATFDGIRPVLDPIFATYSKKSKVTGYDGINHMKTLMLIEDKKQLQMLNFLRENYQPEEKGAPSLTDLYINAMVPEWTVNVFMKEFNFTRSEALDRLQAQEESTVRHNKEDILDTTVTI